MIENLSYEEVLSIYLSDSWADYNKIAYRAKISDNIIIDKSSLSNAWATVNGSGRYAVIGDGSKAYFYRDNILLGSIDYTEKIIIDKIEIKFYNNPAYNTPPMIIKDLYIGNPKFYKSFCN